MKVAENSPAWKRIHEDFKPTLPGDDIRCRDCVFRKPDLIRDGAVIVKGYINGYCKVYTPGISSGKPNDILFDNADCKYYRNDEE